MSTMMDLFDRQSLTFPSFNPGSPVLIVDMFIEEGTFGSKYVHVLIGFKGISVTKDVFDFDIYSIKVRPGG